MAARVTATEVKEIIDTSLSDAIVTAHIDIATLVVDRVEENDAEACHTSASLAKLELLLSAHFVDFRENRISSDKIGDGAESIRNPGVLLKGLESTWYGQSALILDCTGTLANFGKLKASMEIVFELPVETDRRLLP
jgi:hypothetical protein